MLMRSSNIFAMNLVGMSEGESSVSEVRIRIKGAIGEATSNGLVGLVTPGTAMSAFLGAEGVVDPIVFWEHLRMPVARLVIDKRARHIPQD